MDAAALLPAPPLSPAPAPVTTTNTSVPPNHVSYTDSVDSSPRSRNTDSSWDELPTKLRLMCRYGGQIVPRPHDKSLCYVGGETRIVVVERNSTLPDLITRLSKLLLNGHSFILKYQLPDEDLDSLITVSAEEDLDNMIDEYDRLVAGSNPGKSARLRLFLFPTMPESAASMSILDGSNKSGGWFFNMLNGDRGLQRGFSEPNSVDCLLGLDGKVSHPANSDLNSKDLDLQGDGKSGKLGNHNQSSQDVQSVPDSPMIENTSSFDSTSSSPSLGTLPPLQVHVEEGSGGGGSRGLDPRVGIEEQFSQMGVGTQQKHDEGFVVLSSPHAAQPTMAVPTVVTDPPAASEMSNRIVSDDDRSDHGVPAGYRKPPQQPQMLPMIPSQLKQQTGGELTSPDSVSSDSSFSNRQKTVIYQDQISGGGNRVSSNFVDPKVTVSDPNTGVQMQQISESGYALLPQYDQQQHLFLQQQQHQQQQTQPPQSQFIHAGASYIQHHPAGGYYPVYLSQQTHHPHPQLDQRYPVYYVPAGQAQAYNFPGQQTSFGEPANGVPSSLNQNPPNPTMISTSAAYNPSRNEQPTKQEMAAGVYRAAVAPLVQVPSNQHQHQQQSQAQQNQQFVGYTQFHHPTQSMPPNSAAAAAAYAYEFADPAHAQAYFSQPLAPQYKTMTPSPTVVLPDASSQLPTDSIMQQIRTSQAL